MPPRKSLKGTSKSRFEPLTARYGDRITTKDPTLMNVPALQAEIESMRNKNLNGSEMRRLARLQAMKKAREAASKRK